MNQNDNFPELIFSRQFDGCYQFMVRRDTGEAIGMIYKNQPYGLSQIFDHPKLHNLLHIYQKKERRRRYMIKLLKRFLLLMVCFILLPGCLSVTEGIRKANHQNIEAAKFLYEKVTEPEQKQATIDIANNATVVQEGIGEPEEKLPYSPENSAAAQQQARDEIASKKAFFDAIWEKASDALPAWAVSILSVLGMAGTWLSKKALNKNKTDQVTALVTGIDSGLDEIKAICQKLKAGESIAYEDIDKVFKKALEIKQGVYNIAPDIKELIAILKQNGTLKSAS